MGFWKSLLVVVLVILVIGGASLVWVSSRVNHETVTPLTVTDPGGTTGSALVVYQPGLSSFPKQVTTAFAEGLAASGWKVSMTTVSTEAPTTVADYDLVVLAAPVYGGEAAKPLAGYIVRVGDFGGKPVVILLTAAGAFHNAITAAEKMVTDAHGRPIRSLGLMTMRPNDEQNRYTGSNKERAVKIARDAGQTLELAGP